MAEPELEETDQAQFAVFAEVKGEDRPLIMSGLSFGRLLDEIVLPWDSNETFFVDGSPVRPDQLRKLKVIRESQYLGPQLSGLHRKLRMAGGTDLKHLAENYHTQVEAIFRSSGTDVTAQVLKAYSSAVKPSLKDYLPKREELIGAAFQVFITAMKSLSST
jgi:hypothetical protein